MAAKGASQDVANTVSHIIAAFYSFRDTVKDARQDSSLKKSKNGYGSARGVQQHSSLPENKHTAQERLDRHIAAAPSAIHHECATGLAAHGSRFQVGDNEALACLAATLIKLNTGLVEIIGCFLSQGKVSKKSKTLSPTLKTGSRTRKELHLDYHRLAILSEASRIETCQSLIDLRKRLACQPSVPHAPQPPSSSRQTAEARRRPTKHTSPSAAASKPIQWAVVRTRPRIENRKISGSSVSSATSATLIDSASGGITPITAQPCKRPRNHQRQGGGVQSLDTLPASPALSGTTVVSSRQSTPPYFNDHGWPNVAPSSPTSPRTPPAPISTFTSPTQRILEPSGPRYRHNDSSRYQGHAEYHMFDQQPHRNTSTAARSCQTATTATSTQLGEIPLQHMPEQPDVDGSSALHSVKRRWRDGVAGQVRINELGTKLPRRGLFANVFRKTPVAANGTF